ncbi:MAG TPA: hypothetical protein VIG68_04160 [Lysobacter sp.]
MRASPPGAAVTRRVAERLGARSPSRPAPRSRAAWLRDALDVERPRIDHPLLKFGVFALVPAVPAFRLHQVIAYGSPLGELHTFGAQAYVGALLLWWASWAVTLVLVAGGLRLAAEAGAAAVLLLRPDRTQAVRRALLGAARAAYFIGVPAWLVWRLMSG